MASEPENFTHAWMRRMEGKFDQMIDDNKEFRARLGRVETTLASGLGSLGEQLAEHSIRMDRIQVRLERIERRLDLVDAG